MFLIQDEDVFWDTAGLLPVSWVSLTRRHILTGKYTHTDKHTQTLADRYTHTLADRQTDTHICTHIHNYTQLRQTDTHTC